MAGKIRNLLPRNGRYYARLTVPAPLRPIVGKRELTEPLGADRTVALRLLSSALHRMQIELDHARDRSATLNPTARTKRPALNIRQMALAHYASEMDHDTALRSFPGAYDPEGAALFRTKLLYILKRASSGGAADDDALAQGRRYELPTQNVGRSRRHRSPARAGISASRLLRFQNEWRPHTNVCRWT